MKYVQDSDSSDSDSEDNLMVSQELRPGFSHTDDDTSGDRNSPTDSLPTDLSSLTNSFPNRQAFLLAYVFSVISPVGVIQVLSRTYVSDVLPHLM